jgi:hypothetical protein
MITQNNITFWQENLQRKEKSPEDLSINGNIKTDLKEVGVKM